MTLTKNSVLITVKCHYNAVELITIFQGTTITVVENELDFRITTDSPYLDLPGYLWGVLCGDFGVNWPRYNGISLYTNTRYWHPFPLYISLPDHSFSGGIQWPQAWVSAQIHPPTGKFWPPLTPIFLHTHTHTHLPPCTCMRLYFFLGIQAMLYSCLLSIHLQRDMKFQWRYCEGNG